MTAINSSLCCANVGGAPVTAFNPAVPGEMVIVYATGLGLVGPGSNYGVLNEFQTWVCSAAMLLGRLEVFTILVLFTPTLWRK